jgi:hypothetical protein
VLTAKLRLRGRAVQGRRSERMACPRLSSRAKGKPVVYENALCEQEGCAEPVCFEIWDDDGPVRGECEAHAIVTVENSNGELRLKDPRQ